MIVQTWCLCSKRCLAFHPGPLARAFMPRRFAPFRNPLTDFVVALTDFMVKPCKIIPGAFGLDLASLVTAWLAQPCFWASKSLMVPDAAMAPTFWPGLIVVAGVPAPPLLYLLIGVVLIQAILSDVALPPDRPVLFGLDQAPFARCSASSRLVEGWISRWCC